MRWSRFKVYQKEKKALHKLCMRIKGNPKLAEKDVVIAFGNGCSGSLLPGSQPTPTKKVRRKLERYAMVVEVSEMRTSCVCSHGCGWDEEAGEPADAADEKKRKKSYDLKKVRGQKDASGRKGRKLHAILFCHKCRTMWNRDVNAARNIAMMFLYMRMNGEKWPPWFCPRRGSGAPTEEEEGGSNPSGSGDGESDQRHDSTGKTPPQGGQTPLEGTEAMQQPQSCNKRQECRVGGGAEAVVKAAGIGSPSHRDS